MTNHPVNTFSVHYRSKYGQPVGKIPLDAGVVCPNRQNGGCIYCHPDSFKPFYLNKDDSISVQVELGKKYLLKDRFQIYFGYFQQETSTAQAFEPLMHSLAMLMDDKDCVGVILSTRPDCLDELLVEKMVDLALDSGKEFLVEIGLQSIHPKSLKLLNRNHSGHDFIDAAARLKKTSALQVGVHLILGIPGESEEDMLKSLHAVCDLGVDAIKLHHLQIIRGTPLHTMYKEKEFSVFTVESYVELLAKLLPEIPKQVVMHRLWSHSHPDILVAPRWDQFAGNLSALLRGRMEELGVYQGKNVQ